MSLLMPFMPYGIEGNQMDCPICGSHAHAELSNWDRRFKPLKHVRCTDCGLIRQSPLPSEAALKDYYTNDYRADYQKVAFAPTDKHRSKRLIEGAARLEKLKPLLPDGADILDFGCGSGEFVELCGKAGFNAMGFEPGAGYATYAREERELDVICGNWQDIDIDRKFDAVTSFHVFEHLVDPISAFQKVQSWLKPEGIFYIETPNIKNALHKGFGCLHFAHTLGFTKASLERLGAQNGMGIAKTVDEYDIGLIFKNGDMRAIDDIIIEARQELGSLTKKDVYRQFWLYTARKLIGKRKPR